jgi:hypothetical protein
VIVAFIYLALFSVEAQAEQRKTQEVHFEKVQYTPQTLKTYPFFKDLIAENYIEEDVYFEIATLKSSSLVRPLLFVNIVGTEMGVCERVCPFAVFAIKGKSYERIPWDVNGNGPELYTAVCPDEFDLILTGPGKAAYHLWRLKNNSFEFVGGYEDLTDLPECKEH